MPSRLRRRSAPFAARAPRRALRRAPPLPALSRRAQQRHPRYHRGVRRVALLLLLLVPEQARAQGDEAAHLLLDGMERMRAGEYEAAISRFERAYVLSRDPRILAHAAEAYGQLGRCKQSLALHETAKRLLPNDPDPTPDSGVGKCLAPPASPASAPPPAPVPLPDPDGDRVPSRAVAHPVPVAGLVTIGGGVLLGGLGIYFGLEAQKASDRVSSYRGVWTPEYQDLERRGQRDETLSLVFLGAGGAALLTGAILLVVDHGEDDVFAAAPLPGGGQVVWTCAF